jgi:uncharacterized protein (DUF488 family)
MLGKTSNTEPATIIFTIGHSTRSLEEFIGMLREAGVDHLADVRRFPHSRRQPQFNIETFPAVLAEANIGYTHFEALGGRRPKRTGAPSHNTLWRVEAFRNYADYAETKDFHAAFDALQKLARSKRVAIMCAEALWWQCHRRIVADYLLAAGFDVRHILTGKIEPAKLTEGAIVKPDKSVLYSDTPLLAG